MTPEHAARSRTMAFLEFEAAMLRLGFVEQPPQLGMLHQYTHPDAKHQRFGMEAGERYSAALCRLRSELEAARGGQP